jgi:hypothetical protein
VAVGVVKRAVHQGMETSLRQGLSTEMIETIRCFDNRQTKAALAIYAGLLKDKVDLPQGSELGVEELMKILDSDSFAQKVAQ